MKGSVLATHALHTIVITVTMLALFPYGANGAAGNTPVVDAGPAKTIAFPAKDLTLFGHATDPNNNPLTVQWTMTNGSAPVSFSASWAAATTVTFTMSGTYTFQLSASNGASTATANTTVTVKAASSQTAFYVDPTYSGSTRDGSAAHPWTSLWDSDSDFAAKWNAINSALASNDVIIYFPARQAGSDTSEQGVPPQGQSLFVNRKCRGGTANCTGTGDTSTHRLTLDGMSMYNTNDAAPSWVSYSGTNKFKINCSNTCDSMSIGWGDDNQRDYVTIRGFEVTGSAARIRWGGNYSVLEYMWVHDVTSLGAEVQFNQAVGDYPGCPDFGRDHDITVRNNLIERGVDEGLYIAGNYNYTSYGGCPAYGNTHSDILIENNTIRDPGANGGEGDGIDLKMGLMNVTVRNNVINNPHNAGEGGAINSPGVFPPARTNYLFEGNRLFLGVDTSGSNYSGGLTLFGQNGTVIRNNVIYNTPGAAGINLADDSNFPSYGIEIYNNTLYGNAAGVIFSNTHGAKLRNNLVFANGNGQQITGNNSDGIDSDYNLLSPAGSQFAEGSHSIVRSSTSGIVANPGGGDFHLVSGSPAIGKGQDLSSMGFDTDCCGTPR